MYFIEPINCIKPNITYSNMNRVYHNNYTHNKTIYPYEYITHPSQFYLWFSICALSQIIYFVI